MRKAVFVASVLICNIYGQSGSSGDVSAIGPGISAPTVIQKVEPQYSPEAQAAEIEGTVIFQLVVDEQGQAANIKVVNPLGFGLDELGQAAIQAWRFQPATKDGKAVKVAAAIEVHFGLKGRLNREKRREELNRALQQLQNEPKQKEHALRTIQDLAKEKLPEAMYMLGQFLRREKSFHQIPIGPAISSPAPLKRSSVLRCLPWPGPPRSRRQEAWKARRKRFVTRPIWEALGPSISLRRFMRKEALTSMPSRTILKLCTITGCVPLRERCSANLDWGN
jgi:TonB family protein